VLFVHLVFLVVDLLTTVYCFWVNNVGTTVFVPEVQKVTNCFGSCCQQINQGFFGQSGVKMTQNKMLTAQEVTVITILYFGAIISQVQKNTMQIVVITY
jgi:hypothetical protein